MKQLSTGQFFGQTNAIIQFDGITLTDTEYTHSKVDWHYHQNPYFTFILQGNVIEGNKKEIYQCSPGTLLFHNWQESHYNIKPDGFTRGFHIELEKNWIDKCDLALDSLEGNVHIKNPNTKVLLYKIFRESKINDSLSNFSIQALLLQTFAEMQHFDQRLIDKNPPWVKTLNELLNDQNLVEHSLHSISEILGIHAVHLCRAFPKYFHCSFGEYLRKLKVEKSLSLLANKNNSLTEIAYESGFSDQSHFIRTFKEAMGINPSAYRKILLGI